MVPTTLHGELIRAAEDSGDDIFLEDDRGHVTFATMARRAASVAETLASQGVRAGDRIAIAATNRREWVDVLFAASQLGAVLVTLNVRYRDVELTHMLRQSGAKVALSERWDGDVDLKSVYARVVSEVPSLERVIYLDAPDRCQIDSDAPAHWFEDDMSKSLSVETADDPDAPVVILYTSGTTGSSKGAVLTHRSLLAAAGGEVERIAFAREDRMLGTMPLNHVGGLTCTLLAALVARGSVILHRTFSPTAALNALGTGGITIFAGVPTMWKLLLKLSRDRADNAQDAFPALRAAIIGGSNAEPELCSMIQHAAPKARLVNLYGMSEYSGPCLMSELDDDVDTISRTLGTMLKGVETRVIDFDGQLVGHGRDGQLQVRGAGVAAGYWDDTVHTAETFLRDGWLATGDVVASTPTGHFEFRGRSKEMFIQGGYNVYPVEVENVLTDHPGVTAAAGIGMSDDLKGQVGYYFVVPRDGAEISPAILKEYCSARLANYKVPAVIVILDELPMTATGKVRKAQLMDEAAVHISQQH